MSGYAMGFQEEQRTSWFDPEAAAHNRWVEQQATHTPYDGGSGPRYVLVCPSDHVDRTSLTTERPTRRYGHRCSRDGEFMEWWPADAEGWPRY